MDKPISHFERCRTRCQCDVVLPHRPIVRQVRTQIFDERSKTFVTKVEMKTIDRTEEMKPYKVSDFSLNNLIAVGAKLDPTRLDASPLKAVADMEQSLARLDAHIEKSQTQE